MIGTISNKSFAFFKFETFNFSIEKGKIDFKNCEIIVSFVKGINLRQGYKFELIEFFVESGEFYLRDKLSDKLSEMIILTKIDILEWQIMMPVPTENFTEADLAGN